LIKLVIDGIREDFAVVIVVVVVVVFTMTIAMKPESAHQ
jgi:hypothetical protein